MTARARCAAPFVLTASLALSCTCQSAGVNCQLSQFLDPNTADCALDDSGRLSVNYLGTDPPANVVSMVDTKELNYEEMDEEQSSRRRERGNVGGWWA